LLWAFGNVLLLRWPRVLHGYRVFGLGGAVGIAGMTAMVIFFTAKNTTRLYREERIQ